MTESPRAFSCSEKGCGCILWKDMLIRGKGPEINEKILRLILEKKEVTGSSGSIVLKDGWIQFYPKGENTPSVSRPLVYQKKDGR